MTGLPADAHGHRDRRRSIHSDVAVGRLVQHVQPAAQPDPGALRADPAQRPAVHADGLPDPGEARLAGRRRRHRPGGDGATSTCSRSTPSGSATSGPAPTPTAACRRSRRTRARAPVVHRPGVGHGVPAGGLGQLHPVRQTRAVVRDNYDARQGAGSTTSARSATADHIVDERARLVGRRLAGHGQHPARLLPDRSSTSSTADLLAKMATALGKHGRRHAVLRTGRAIAGRLPASAYFDPTTGVFGTGTQLAYAMPLVLGIVPAGTEQATREPAGRRTSPRTTNHVTTGFVGTTFVFQALGAVPAQRRGPRHRRAHRLPELRLHGGPGARHDLGEVGQLLGAGRHVVEGPHRPGRLHRPVVLPAARRHPARHRRMAHLHPGAQRGRRPRPTCPPSRHTVRGTIVEFLAARRQHAHLPREGAGRRHGHDQAAAAGRRAVDGAGERPHDLQRTVRAGPTPDSTVGTGDRRARSR